jgi:hypothetical protein
MKYPRMIPVVQKSREDSSLYDYFGRKKSSFGSALVPEVEVLGIFPAVLISSRTHEEGRPHMQGSG